MHSESSKPDRPLCPPTFPRPPNTDPVPLDTEGNWRFVCAAANGSNEPGPRWNLHFDGAPAVRSPDAL